MEHQISHLCKQLCFELRKISQLSYFLTKESIQMLISAFIFSRLDYCNSLLSNVNKDQLCRLQRIQNHAARLISKTSLKTHITPTLVELHWLPVRARIEFKIALLCHKSLNNKAPLYLSNLIETYHPVRALRSADKSLLKIKQAKYKKLGERAFSVCAPTLWNSIPLDIRNINAEKLFKTKLKTYLFRKNFEM